MKTTQKGSAVLFVIIGVLLIIAAAGYYFSSQKTSLSETLIQRNITIPTSSTKTSLYSIASSTTQVGWNLYTNTQYRFELEYPVSLIVDTNGLNITDVEYSDEISPILSNKFESSVVFNVVLATTTTMDNANVFVVESNGRCLINTSSYSGTISTTTINNKEFVITDLDNAATAEEMTGAMYSTTVNDTCYSIGWYEEFGIPNILYGDYNSKLAKKYNKQDDIYTNNLKILFQNIINSFSVKN